jgi:hypothetical protein
MMDNNRGQEAMTAETSGPKSVNVSVTSIVVWISVSIWLWSLCWLMPFWFVILFVTPFLLGIVVICYMITRRGLLRHITIAGQIHWLYPLLVFVVTVSAPLSSYFYGRWIAEQFVQSLGIPVELIDQKVSILEQFGFGERRGVRSNYQIQIPLDDAKERMLERIEQQGRPAPTGDPIVDLGWQISNDGQSAGCASWETTPNSIMILPNGQLFVALLHNSSPFCRLQND